MSNYLPKQERVNALKEAKAKLVERFYNASTELEDVKRSIHLIDAQLIVMSGLEDPPQPETPNGDN